MQGTIRQVTGQAGWVLVALAAVSILVLALMGQVPEVAAGWLVTPALLVGEEKRRRTLRRRCGYWRAHLWALGRYLRQSWQSVLIRSLLLWLLWAWSGCWGAEWPWLVPWGLWLWRGLGVGWPRLRTQAPWRWVEEGLWQGQRLLLIGYAGLALWQGWLADAVCWPLGLCCVVGISGAPDGVPDGAPDGAPDCAAAGPRVDLLRAADGSYEAQLSGDFTLRVAGDDPLRLRLLLILLSQLDVADGERGSRRTRDGRTPFVRQMQMAAWLDVPQPCISRWLGYWHVGNWADLLSLHSPEVLTRELCARIVTVCATFPHWGVARVYQHLREQGVAVTQAQVQQAVTQSGWQQLQQTLAARYEVGESALRLRDEWLVEQLLAQIALLLTHLETNQPLPPEVRTTLVDLTTLATAAGASTPPPLTIVPWLRRMEQLLFGPWAAAGAEQLPGAHTLPAHAASPHDGQDAKTATPAVGSDLAVRCPYCGSDQVGRKSATPRTKQYYDAQQQLCTVPVYRYYCRNPQCDKGSFTDLPPGLAPYSRYRTEMHILAVQMYAWGYATYRCTGAALGVTSLTAWRWVSAWGYALLPIAALFGVVKSSGVVGVDEKYVLVPKNDKPAGAMRRWMYVYLAVDVWTYDLLHIAIYPHNTLTSAQAFLLALRAKGYHPQVIVTDLRQDYGPVIAAVFPQASHHECIFHALQQVQRLFKDVYGPDYLQNHPAAALKQQIYAIFAAKTCALAQTRCAAVLALQQDYCQTTPAAAVIFTFLAHHWPTLVNGIASDLIPATNNAVERVIRRFDQHYHHFCGFESIRHAQRYLAVFEKTYRFTPFSQDAQPAVRGRSPLQLAGYDVASSPMSSLSTGLSILWPIPIHLSDHVPKS